MIHCLAPGHAKFPMVVPLPPPPRVTRPLSGLLPSPGLLVPLPPPQVHYEDQVVLVAALEERHGAPRNLHAVNTLCASRPQPPNPLALLAFWFLLL